MCDTSKMSSGAGEVKSFQGFGKRTTSITKIHAPPGGHCNINLFGGSDVEEEVGPGSPTSPINKCQYERNKSSITEQYTGATTPEVEIKTTVVEHALPQPKKPSTKVIHPPGGKTSLCLFG